MARGSSLSKAGTGTTTASCVRIARPRWWAKVSSRTETTSSVRNAPKRSSWQTRLNNDERTGCQFFKGWKKYTLLFFSFKSEKCFLSLYCLELFLYHIKNRNMVVGILLLHTKYPSIMSLIINILISRVSRLIFSRGPEKF